MTGGAAKADQQLAIGALVDADTGAAPVTQLRAGQCLCHLLRLQIGEPLQLVQHQCFLVAQLRLRRQVLQLTAATVAVIGAGRLAPLGRGREYLQQPRFVMALVALGDLYPDLLAGQGTIDEQGLALQARHAPPFQTEVGDAQRGRRGARGSGFAATGRAAKLDTFSCHLIGSGRGGRILPMERVGYSLNRTVV